MDDYDLYIKVFNFPTTDILIVGADSPNLSSLGRLTPPTFSGENPHSRDRGQLPLTNHQNLTPRSTPINASSANHSSSSQVRSPNTTPIKELWDADIAESLQKKISEELVYILFVIKHTYINNISNESIRVSQREKQKVIESFPSDTNLSEKGNRNGNGIACEIYDTIIRIIDSKSSFNQDQKQPAIQKIFYLELIQVLFSDILKNLFFNYVDKIEDFIESSKHEKYGFGLSPPLKEKMKRSIGKWKQVYGNAFFDAHDTARNIKAQISKGQVASLFASFFEPPLKFRAYTDYERDSILIFAGLKKPEENKIKVTRRTPSRRAASRSPADVSLPVSPIVEYLQYSFPHSNIPNPYASHEDRFIDGYDDGYDDGPPPITRRATLQPTTARRLFNTGDAATTSSIFQNPINLNDLMIKENEIREEFYERFLIDTLSKTSLYQRYSDIRSLDNTRKLIMFRFSYIDDLVNKAFQEQKLNHSIKFNYPTKKGPIVAESFWELSSKKIKAKQYGVDIVYGIKACMGRMQDFLSNGTATNNRNCSALYKAYLISEESHKFLLSIICHLAFNGVNLVIRDSPTLDWKYIIRYLELILSFECPSSGFHYLWLRSDILRLVTQKYKELKDLYLYQDMCIPPLQAFNSLTENLKIFLEMQDILKSTANSNIFEQYIDLRNKYSSIYDMTRS
tara:strand:- start:123 stop:2165 length:2043 start_codon:yes stop_codon:yes gene_type:complete